MPALKKAGQPSSNYKIAPPFSKWRQNLDRNLFCYRIPAPNHVSNPAQRSLKSHFHFQATVAALRQLEVLRLNFCPRVSDKGIGHVTGLPRLVRLELGSCPKITDAGLQHMSTLYAAYYPISSPLPAWLFYEPIVPPPPAVADGEKSLTSLRSVQLVQLSSFQPTIVSGSVYVFRFAISVIAKYDARVYLVWSLLGILPSFVDHYIQSSFQFPGVPCSSMHFEYNEHAVKNCCCCGSC